MPGLGGLATLEAIKERDPLVPVVLVTKNEADSLMAEAIGKHIADSLIKPVRPTQIFLALRRLLEADRLQDSQRARGYVAEQARLRAESTGGLDWRGWIDLYARSAQWDVELDQVDDEGLKQAQADQRRELNVEFSSYVESHYQSWVGGGDGPPMSSNVVERWVAPHLREGGRVFLLVIDCMRLDQWLTVEPLLRPYFDIDLRHQVSILPSATPYSRNAIFSGLLPDEIQPDHPNYWQEASTDERSKNRFERQLLDLQLARLDIKLPSGLKYVKIYNAEEASHVRRNIV